jgi:hypothetical protein
LLAYCANQVTLDAHGARMDSPPVATKRTLLWRARVTERIADVSMQALNRRLTLSRRQYR